MKDLILLLPVYNDADCLKILCNNIVFQELAAYNVQMVVVNDGSTGFDFNKKEYSFPIDIIHLHSNLGHQKALAIGLSYIYHHKKAFNVIVMDADGEDKPEDILTLLKPSSTDDKIIVFAKRIRRKESLQLRAGYQLYKLLFSLLTGRSISFGNFVCIPFRYLENLVYKNDIWNHLAAGILKSNLPFASIPVEKKKRFAGESKMKLSKLVLHGFGAITVFIEQVSTRLLMFSLLLLVITTFSIGIIIIIKIITDLAIPGWASTLTGVMMIMFLQSFLMALFTLFLYISSQSQRQFIPGVHYKEFISGYGS